MWSFFTTNFKGKDKNQKLKKGSKKTIRIRERKIYYVGKNALTMEEILWNLCSVVRAWKIKRQNDSS